MSYERAVERLIAAAVQMYWALPGRDRGDFVMWTMNSFIRDLGARRPALPLAEVDRQLIDVGQRLVRAIDYPSGDPVMAARVFEHVAPAGRA